MEASIRKEGTEEEEETLGRWFLHRREAQREREAGWLTYAVMERG